MTFRDEQKRYLYFMKHLREMHTNVLELRPCFLISMGCIRLWVQQKTADLGPRFFREVDTASILHNSTFEC